MIRTIGLFLLLLLKILGWTLLILLLFLIVMLLLALFVPVRYEVQMHNERSTEPGQNNPIAELRLQLKVNWLLHLLHVSISYGPEGKQNKIRVIGIDIQKMLAQFAKRKEAKQKRREAKKRRRTVQESDHNLQTKKTAAQAAEKEQQKKTAVKAAEKEQQIEPESTGTSSNTKMITEEGVQVSENSAVEGEKIPFEEASSSADREPQVQPLKKESGSDAKSQAFVLKDGSEMNIDAEEQSAENRAKTDIQAQKSHIKRKTKRRGPQKRPKRSKESSKPGILTKIRTQLNRLHKEFTDEVNRHAVSRLWKELLKLLLSYKPRKLKADLTFSLANPALTGEAIGMISLMPWIYRYPCSIIPDFTSDKLYIEGEILARGKVTVFVFAVSLLRLLRDKKFMQVARRLMKRNGS